MIRRSEQGDGFILDHGNDDSENEEDEDERRRCIKTNEDRCRRERYIHIYICRETDRI